MKSGVGSFQSLRFALTHRTRLHLQPGVIQRIYFEPHCTAAPSNQKYHNTLTSTTSFKMSGASEEKWTGPVVRDTFIKFFEDKQHTVVPSSSVVAPPGDETLLFANAGMNQFKEIFTGEVARTDPLSNLKKAVDTQKCIRAGGKHNDLDDVGKDSYHHTFFEMLGNWSFGDYFKKEAIEMSWELLTKVYGISPDQLYVTYFEGDSDTLQPDIEARDIWKSVGVPEDHIITGDMKDNFWEMGEYGPCGPCSEIHYDRIGGRNAASLVNMDDPNVLEIWNIVFITYNREKPSKKLKLLPAKHIDTGMGFERLVSVLQNKQTNYDTDIFWPIFHKIQEVTGKRPYTDKYGADDTDKIDTSYRICADHLRTAAFSINDGAVPDKDGAGYVVRRVVRRGARYAKYYFGINLGKESFFSQILPTLVAQMGGQFPDLIKNQNFIKEVLDQEESAFAATIEKGKARYDKLAAQAKKNGSFKISGVDAFRLYDTYGYPTDLTKLICEEDDIALDMDEVKEAEMKHKEASKSKKTETKSFARLDVHNLSYLNDTVKLPETDQAAKYLTGTISAKVKYIFDGKNFLTTTKDLPPEKRIGLLLDKTNFYAESGGQIADVGKIYIEGDKDDATFEVEDVQVLGGYVLHNGFLNYGTLSTDDEVTCQYDEPRRHPIINNHTATHVLNHSLRDHLGEGVVQEGSLVDTDKLRFDFKHMTAVTRPQIKLIEDSSNACIKQNLKVYAKDVPFKIAETIHGIRAAFGDKYPDPVRVVSVGIDVNTLIENPRNPEWQKYSIEFCGGTHVAETGIIKEIVIVDESGIAKGTRRIVAYTGMKAAEVQLLAEDFARKIEATKKMDFDSLKVEKVKELQNALSTLTVSLLTKDELKKDLEAVQKSVLNEQKARQKRESKVAVDAVTAYFEQPENKNSPFYVARLPTSAESKVVSDVLNLVKKSHKEKSVCVLASGANDSEVAHGVYVGTEHSKKISAEEVAKVVSQIVGGASGGKEPSRTGRGTDPSKTDDAVASVTKLFEEKLKV